MNSKRIRVPQQEEAVTVQGHVVNASNSDRKLLQDVELLLCTETNRLQNIT